MRLVLDTNCVVSAFLWGGIPYQIVETAVEGRCRLFTSAALLAELEEILMREKFKPRFLAVQTSVARLLVQYIKQVTVIHAASIPPTVIDDPDDDAVLACALAAQADLIVSGDSDLLDLTQYQGIPIVPPAEALKRVEAA